jgi:hypothetical protein
VTAKARDFNRRVAVIERPARRAGVGSVSCVILEVAVAMFIVLALQKVTRSVS